MKTQLFLHLLPARHPPYPFLRLRKYRRDHPRPQVPPWGDRPRRLPPRHHHRPPEQAPRHRLHPHPRRGQRRRQETLPAEEARPRPRGYLPVPAPAGRRGGGVVFGPKARDWTIKINRKEKQLAISTAVSSAAENLVCVEEFGEKFEKPRTKEFIEAMRRWGLDPKEKVMFLVSDLTDNVGLSGRNIGTLRMLTPRTLNLFDILNSDKLVLTPDTVEYLNYIDGENAEVETEEEEEEEEEGREEGG